MESLDVKLKTLFFLYFSGMRIRIFGPAYLHLILHHRRWIKTEEKATVVVSVWEEEFIKIPSRASCFVYRTILKNRMNSSFSFKSFRCNSSYILFKIVLGKIAYAARNWINSSPQTEAMTFAFSSVFILLLCTRTPRSISKNVCPASDNDSTSFCLSLIQSEDEGTSPRCVPSLW